MTVLGLRRGGVWLVGAVAAFGCVTCLGVSIAGAHSCAEPVTLPADTQTEVNVGVTVGDVPTGDVTFQFAEGFEVSPGEVRGWDGEAGQTTVHFTGGELEAGSCAVFPVAVKTKTSGTYRVRAFQKLDSGQVVEHPPDGDIFLNPDGTSLVVNHEGPPNAAFEQVVVVTEGPGGSSGARLGLALVTVGALLIGGAVLVSRRRRT